MSRAFIEVVAAATILGFTGAAYYVTTSTLEGEIHTDLEARVVHARDQAVASATLESLGRLNQVEALAAEPALVQAMRTPGKERSQLASLAFRRFIQGLSPEAPRPDIVALTDATGDVVAMLDVPNPVPGMWKNGNEIEYRAIALALSGRQIVSEVWNYEREGLMKVGVAPVLDEADTALGALVVAYSMSALEAQRQHQVLGEAELVYFEGDRIYATSFRRPAGAEDTNLRSQLGQALAHEQLGPAALAQGVSPRPVPVVLDDEEYLASAARLPQLSSRPRPDDYPASMAGVMVMISLSDALAPLGTIKLAILLLGLAAAILSVLAVEVAARRILHQADEIEAGINEIAGGNVDQTFRSVGADLDGLASALNVMLARLLGRPEGDEGQGFHDAPVDLEDVPSAATSADPATVALASEPEVAYYRRLFDEYLEACRRTGELIDGIQYDDFVAKLRLTEGQLKRKYQCRVVRFRVVTKSGKVTLKPVPIA